MASENGWEPSHAGPDILEWVTVPGTDPPVTVQLMKGPPSRILRAWIADWNANIEHVRDADTAGFTPTNAVATSNHLNGSAVDIDWDGHPFHQRGTLNADQMRILREMLDFYEGTVFWAGDWDDPVDEMHSQMGYNTWNNPHTQDFITRKIRPDGFSTFRRGSAPAPAPVAPAVDVLSRAMGATAGVDYAGLLLAVTQCLRDCDCTTVNRIAMWMAQVGHESAGLKYMEEIASGAAYEGRGDLGNTQPGDGVRFKGRGPIQVTGRHNYTVLSKWAFDKGLVPSATFFVDQPAQLASTRYGFIGVTWYWTTQRPMNDAADVKDVVRATQYVNGGQNGIDDRSNRYNRALGMGDQLLTLTSDTGDDELSAEAERMIRELYDEYQQRKRGPSRSFVASDGNPVDSPLGFLWNIDGNVWTQTITWSYLFGVKDAEQIVTAVAETGVAPNTWAAQQVDASGRKWLSEFGQQYCQGLIALRAAMQKAFKGQPAAMTVSAPEPQVVYVDRPVPAVPAPTPAPEPANLPATGGTTGQLIAGLYDAVANLNLASASSIEDRAALSATIKILETKNGSQL